MSAIREAQEIDHGGRRLLGSAAAAAITGNFSFAGAAVAQRNQAITAAGKSVAYTSLTSLKQIDAGVLNVGDAEVGPEDAQQ